jgi:hypothetical protein
MSDLDDEVAQLLDEAVARLSTTRRTFTDEEALRPIWERGYDFSPQSDPQGRFALAAEADGKHPRQWRIATQALANNRLLDALRSGAWNGQDLDAELARLDAQDQTHYTFCPNDARFTTLPDGTLELVEREYNVILPLATKASLDALGPQLLERWHDRGDEPLTVRQVTEQLGKLGWAEASERNGWQLARVWLLAWPEVARVGQDYWVPVVAMPKEPGRTRLQVLPVGGATSTGEERKEERSIPQRPDTPGQETPPRIDNSPIPQSREAMANRVSWTFPLRTIHLLEGFLPVPAAARSAYPPRGVGEGDREAYRGLWYDNDERLWLWLDRNQDRLYGPDLAQKLEWLEAGDLLRVQWAPDVVILRLAGHDDEVQREEERLVDPQALKALRGGVGESYRQSLQAILSEKSEGLTFTQVVQALRERQGHDVPRNTVRAILYAGAFLHQNSRWFAAPQSEQGARKLRAALVETLVSTEEAEQMQTSETELITDAVRQHRKLHAIRVRLAELMLALRESL